MKVGRNSPCPCRSGKKYKHCCGEVSPKENILSNIPPETIAKIKEWAGRVRQYEHFCKVEYPARFGSIQHAATSLSHDGTRHVAVGNQIYKSGADTTWYGFLYDHLQEIVNPEWFWEESQKPIEQMHIMVRWFKETCRIELDENKRFSLGRPETDIPATLAFRSLAYDLFCLQQMKSQVAGTLDGIMGRLKHPDHFEGARYELWVIACFLKAGFTLELEDETDRRKTHCEFTATHPPTGAKYSVEAKRRHRLNINHVQTHKNKEYVKPDVQGLVSKALAKQASQYRIIFIDVNMPPTEGTIVNAAWVKEFQASKEVLEMQKQYRVKSAPSAFLFATNHPYHYLTTEKPDSRTHFFTTSFNQPDYYKDPNLIPKQHPAVFHLMKSVASHFEIPVDFIDNPPKVIQG